MRKFIVKICFRIVTYSIVFYFVTCCDNIDNSYQSNLNVDKLQSMHLYDSLDVLFVGNSYCYSGVNTRQLDSLGKKVYNLGVASAGVNFYKLILTDYLKTVNTPPERVLLLLSPMTFSNQADNFEAYPIHRYLRTPKSHLEIYRKNKNFRIAQAYAASFKKGIKNILMNVVESNINNHLDLKQKQSTNLGFLINRTELDSSTYKTQHPKLLPLKNEVFNKNRIEEMKALCENLETQGIEVVYFQLPTGGLTNYFSHEYLTDYKEGLQKLSEQNRLINVPSDGLGESNYRNIDHLNTFGAGPVTNYLLEHLW